MRLQNKRVIIFDFDGTLADTEDLLFRAFNGLADQYHYPPITKEEILKLEDKDIKKFISTHAKIPFWKLWRFTQRLKEEYKLYIDTVQLFPDIKEVLDALQKQGYVRGIVSSNSSDTISKILRRFDISVDFIITSSLFGKSGALNALARKRRFDKSKILYIGDEVRNVEAYQKSHIDMLAITWGLNSKATLQKADIVTVDFPRQILESLGIDTTLNKTNSI